MLTLTSKQLATICAGFNKIVARSPSIPILRYILVRADGLMATNLQETLAYQLDGPPVPFLVAYDDLKRLAAGLSKSGTVTLTLVDHGVEATIDDGQAMTQSLDTLATDEFPDQPMDAEFADLDLDSFLTAYQAAARAASTDPTREALNGVHCDPAGSCLVGTDGHRLMKIPADLPSLAQATTIPVTKLLASPVLKGAGAIAFTDEHLFLQAGPWSYRNRLTDLAYPNYAAVIPSRENTARIDLGQLDPKALTRAIRQFPNTGRALYLYADAQRAAILAADTASGYVAIDLPGASAATEDPITVAFDRRYFSDAIMAGFRNLAIADCYKPVSFYRADACCILMPLRENQAKAITAWMNRSINPEPEAAMPDPDDTPKPGSDPAPDPEPKLTVLPNPLDEFLDTVTAAEAALKDATTCLRDVKRGVKTFVRDARREQRDHAAKLKEIRVAREAIAKLQAVNF